MIVVQSTGYPSGNHGMFYKYRVEAITLRSVYDRKISDVSRHIGFESLGRYKIKWFFDSHLSNYLICVEIFWVFPVFLKFKNSLIF